MKFRVIMAVCGMLVMLVACGKKEDTVYSGEEGEVTVTRDAGGRPGKVTVTGENGTATMEVGKAELPADLGITLYPGAAAGEGGMLQVENEEGADSDSVFSVSVHSDDGIDKVADYYKNELRDARPRIFEMAMPTGKMVTITIEQGGTVKTVVISQNTAKGGTDIQITRIKE
jgi:hypothetical protein